MKTTAETAAYSGGKAMWRISGEYWDNTELMCKLVSETAASLPMPKIKTGAKTANKLV